MGRPRRGEEHPREELRSQIKVMVASGLGQREIAGIFKMSLETLNNHYREELDLGMAHINAIVGGQIFRAIQKGEEWALKFYAARRMGWKETAAHGLTGRDGVPLEQPRDDRELARRVAFILRRAQHAGANGAGHNGHGENGRDAVDPESGAAD